ncbi:unnamed protein product [Chilo suppressalis]|uniref:PSI domain-containing protein n=1 Tax=Chilo suppressalis TaxID=168631 RepID=A0ABN8AYK6_CHISP|nr:unnamed protein product [Chilo suppressalis]
MANWIVISVFFQFLLKNVNSKNAFHKYPGAALAGPFINATIFEKPGLTVGDKRRLQDYLNSFTNLADTPVDRIIETPTSYCRSFRTCSDCFRSTWYPCGWCHDYGCTNQPEIFCPDAVKRSDLKDLTDLEDFCPRIHHKGSILVHAGVRQNLRVKVHIADPVLYKKDLVCQIKFKNRLTHLKALILNGEIFCYPVTMNTTHKGNMNKGIFRVIWGGVNPFSNEIPVFVYRCEALASECDDCIDISPEYSCGWCESSSNCVIAEHCEDILKWYVNRLTCKTLNKNDPD